MIPGELLEKYGATKLRLNKGEELFAKDEMARYYFQIIDGQVKMNNFNDEGREFIQGMFHSGESFGEPPLFADFKYPANAISVAKTELYQLEKMRLFDLLKDHPEINLEFTTVLARRLHYKAKIAANISIEDADHRILTLIDYLKQEKVGAGGKFEYEVPLTRQQIADLTGLRVETVIRHIKDLCEQGELKILERHVWR